MIEPRLIPLRDRHGDPKAWALVDPVDYDRIADRRWRLNTGGYAATNLEIDGRQRYRTMHREVLDMALDDPRDVDHLNGNRLDNRRSNLRVGTRAENHQNRTRSGGTSKHRGVCWDADHECWRAQVKVEDRTHYLGLFEDEQDAVAAAAAGRRRLMPRSLG